MEWTAETPPTAKDIAAYYRREIANGNLAPSHQLPAGRGLAAKLHVATMTVQSAYAQLAAEGLVDTRQGSGTFVRDAASGAPSAQDAAQGLRELQIQLNAVTSQLAELTTRVTDLETERASDDGPAS
ncbi:GntR family transcriptional regulator [Streptomyces nanshensis]|uniref:HTH gntR-type domain-containing protein n=1 Tax=Streptomyces nanshensis TaxID=518642 RepID=A0A1E7L2V0_9ACTN|nr:GntR family transcriptional regulator [Streptomyces nanshensis]OEV10509.1 hypothetical protein AN218_17310 [Streptomyces nanshensis]